MVTIPDVDPIKRFVALAQSRNTKGIVDASEIIESVLTGTAYPSWQQAQAWLGLTKRAIRGIGVAPLTDLAPGATPWAIETGDPITAPSGEGPVTTQINTESIPPGVEEVSVNPAPQPPDPPDPLETGPDNWPLWPPGQTPHDDNI